MRVVVAGANGLIGSRLSVLLGERGHQVTALSRGSQREAGAFAYRATDLSDPHQVADRFETTHPEVIVNAAGLTDVDACERDPDGAWSSNVGVVRVLAQAARKHRAHLVHLSTDYVFDGETGPYGEEDVPNPKGVYALTKHIGEQACRLSAPSWSIARTANLYGHPSMGRLNFGCWLVDSLKKKLPVRLFEDQRISPTWAGSAAALIAELV
jgi:dTDP-4-dehydrorhamnose reductase